MKRLSLLIVVVFSLAFKEAKAYPDFIGYGYTSCATCHFNTLGNGPLTDYGRALFSQEIATRTWISESVSDEELAELSSFIPGVQLPYWIRPAIKYRGLWIQTQPGGGSERERLIRMQRDFNVVFSADEESRTILSLTYGLLNEERDYYGKGDRNLFISREHYVRAYLTDEVIIAAGLMDKAYGVRHADHTAFNRTRIGFGQDDQVHGILLHYLKDSWETAVHLFAGNLFQKVELQHKGASATGETSLGKNHRLGASLAAFSNEFSDFKRIAIHDRYGFPLSKGSSLLFELGLKEDRDRASGRTLLGNYMFVQSLINLARGYNLISTFERLQDETKANALDSQRWTFGFLTFPFQRIEVRLTGVQTKTFSPEVPVDDTWAVQGQFHASF